MLTRSNSQTTWYSALALGGILALSAPAVNAQASGSILPPTAPTTISQANTPAPIAATQLRSSDAVARRRARVTYNGGLLNVEANNSSLNGILRDIAQLTGMKITGGVADQRVFGNYGPATPSTVLATLLDGTGSNMLLRETASSGPAELILTPRTGGATPPPPASASYDDAEEVPAPQQSQDQQAMPGQAMQTQQSPGGPQQNQPFNNVLGSPSNTTETPSTIPTVRSVSTDSISQPSTATPVSGIVDSTNPPPAGSTGFGSLTPTQPAANAAPSTPQQIYEQLQKLRQAAQQQSGNGSTVPAATTQQQ